MLSPIVGLYRLCHKYTSCLLILHITNHDNFEVKVDTPDSVLPDSSRSTQDFLCIPRSFDSYAYNLGTNMMILKSTKIVSYS